MGRTLELLFFPPRKKIERKADLRAGLIILASRRHLITESDKLVLVSRIFPTEWWMPVLIGIPSFLRLNLGPSGNTLLNTDTGCWHGKYDSMVGCLGSVGLDLRFLLTLEFKKSVVIVIS